MSPRYERRASSGIGRVPNLETQEYHDGSSLNLAAVPLDESRTLATQRKGSLHF